MSLFLRTFLWVSGGASARLARHHLVAGCYGAVLSLRAITDLFFTTPHSSSVLILLVLSAPILRCVLPGFAALVNTPCRSDSLLSAVVLAVLVRWHPFVSTVQQHRRLLRSLFVVMLLGAGVMTLRPVPFGAFNHTWLAGLYSLLILIAFVGTEPRLGSLLRSSALVWLGQLSYGIYLFTKQ